MQAILLKLGQWVVTAIIIPMVAKWMAGYLKAKKKAKRILQRNKENIKKAEENENNPDSGLSNMP